MPGRKRNNRPSSITVIRQKYLARNPKIISSLDNLPIREQQILVLFVHNVNREAREVG